MKKISKEYLNECDKGTIITNSQFKAIEDLIARDNFIQIIRYFNVNKLLCILNILEENEEYKKCAKIVKQIKIYNRKEGTKYKTHL